jgi:hypothetical protein
MTRNTLNQILSREMSDLRNAPLYDQGMGEYSQPSASDRGKRTLLKRDKRRESTDYMMYIGLEKSLC